MESDFMDNAYIIDLTYAKSAADIIYDLSSCLDNELAKNRKVLLKLGDISLNQSQLMSVKSLISSVNSTLAFLETTSSQTRRSALDLGLIVSGQESMAEVVATPEQTYKTAEEMEAKPEALKEPEVKPETSSVPEKKELDSIFDIEAKLGNIFGSDAPSAPRQAESEYTENDYEIDTLSTMYVKQTLRSGQILSYDGNVLVIGDSHPGSEIVATGDVTVWGMLGGIAHAGSKGNTKARIRALKMNAIQLRIADCYARRPDSLNTIFIEKTDTFTPEEARIVEDEIVIFKMND